MSSNLDYTKMLWENQKLGKFKSLCDFNKNTITDKNLINLQSLNLNYSEIGKKSSKNGDPDISLDQGEIDRILFKKDRNVIDQFNDSDGKINVDLSESYEINTNKSKKDDTDIYKDENKVDKIENKPLPDPDNLNLELLNFSITDKDLEIKEIKIEEKRPKDNIFHQISKKQLSKEIIKRPTQKVKSSNYIASAKSLNIPKYNKLVNRSENTSKKLSIPKDGILVNRSQKITNSNVFSQTNHNETTSLLFSYKLKKVNENYTKLKQTIKESKSKSNSRKSRINLNANSLSNMLHTNYKPTGNNDSFIKDHKNNLLESITKSSCYDTFMITPSKVSSFATIKRSSNTILKQDNKSSNQSINFK